MAATEWEDVDKLLEAALAIPHGQREIFVTNACEGKDALRREVMSLLAGEEAAENFFESPPGDDLDDIFRGDEFAIDLPVQIGPYRILRELGRGGMGLVLLAVRADDAYQKQVAIKLVSPSPLRSDVLRRFRRERQILANLEHPNIARLLDGGTTEQGWPYVVMEYVEGEPLTLFCEQRQLSVPERLRLFMDVCEAVQYAHQNLIIHRDLKPANILVAKNGVVKLLDFGIAKLLAQDSSDNPEVVQKGSDETLTGMLMMTPEYASPEQMRGAPLSTASDVYSLGVLLYELLTGHLPYILRNRALPEIIRAVCEGEPMLPSERVAEPASSAGSERPERLHAQLKGDLDNIVMMALQKEPARRYSVVQQLREDIARHLSNELVHARPATLGYRVQRFARRNLAVVIATALIILTLSAGVAATLYQAGVARRQARANRRLAYAGQMHLGMQAWDLANIGQLSQFVEQSRPQPGEEDLRGFEWYYLWRLAHANGQRLSISHPQEVWSVDVSPDGERIASGCADGKLRVWSAKNGQMLGEYNANTPYVWDVSWSPDGRQIATAGGDARARLWDAATGRELIVFEGHTNPRVNAVVFSPDGSKVATGGRDGTVRVWERQTGHEILKIQASDHWVNSLAFSPDNAQIATVHGGAPIAKLWNAATGQEIRTIAGMTNAAWAIAYSPDGRLLATGDKSGVAHLLEVKTGTEIFTFKGHRDEVKAIAFSPDGRLLASASSDRTVILWNISTGEEVTTLKGHTGQVWSLAFSPDGGTLVTSDTEQSVKVWDLKQALEFTSYRKALPFGLFVVINPDGRRLAIGGRSDPIAVDIATGDASDTSGTYPSVSHAGVFSTDGKILFTGDSDGAASIWELDPYPKKLRSFVGHKSPVHTVSLSPDGRMLATGSSDSTIKLWDTTTGQTLATCNPAAIVRAVAFRPDGKQFASGGHDNLVRIWDVATRREIAEWRGHTKPILTLSYTPDGTALATGSADGQVKLWEVASGRERAIFVGPAGHVRCLSFSPDGTRLATGHSDGLVRLWDVATQQEVIALRAGAGTVTSVAFSNDGQLLVATCSDPVLRIWRAARPGELPQQAGPR